MVTRETLMVSGHAVTRMAAENISIAEALDVINLGDVVQSYP